MSYSHFGLLSLHRIPSFLALYWFLIAVVGFVLSLCFLNLQLNTCPSSPLLCLCVRDCLQQVVSIEKMEDTSLLPNPIIVSIRSKMAFQFIELRDRDSLVEGLLARLKLVHADQPVHYDTTVDEDLV